MTHSSTSIHVSTQIIEAWSAISQKKFTDSQHNGSRELLKPVGPPLPGGAIAENEIISCGFVEAAADINSNITEEGHNSVGLKPRKRS